MQDKNKFVLEGRIEGDPQIDARDKYTLVKFKLIEMKGFTKGGQPITVLHELTAFGDNFKHIKHGMKVTITGEISSREYNGKNYTGLRIKNISTTTELKQDQHNDEGYNNQSDEDIPF